mgnify:CR=1 FL=1
MLYSDYIVEMDEISNCSGLAVELSLTILKALASKVGTHLGVKLLEQLGLAEKQISLEELRRQLVADIEQKNVEQTLREQRGKFTAISWDLTALYPRLKEQEKYSFLLKKEEAVSACLGVLSDSMHCVPGAPDYLTCSSLFLLIIQEIIKATDENPYENPLYKQALQRVLEPVGTLKTGLEKRRRDYVGPTRHIRYDCVQCRGEVMCSNAITWYDQKTGKETWCYPISKEKPKDWDARAANERNQYLISLDRESDWVWEISNMWQEEMNKCR